MSHFWVSLPYSDLICFSFIMSKLHLPWLSLFHTCTISPQLTFDASSWLHIKLIYGAIPFNTVSDSSSDIFSLKYCLFLLQCISFSGYLGKQLKNCYPYCFKSSRSSSKVLFPTSLPPPPIYFFFPFCGSQKLTAVPSETLILYSEFKAMLYQNNALSMLPQCISYWRKL